MSFEISGADEVAKDLTRNAEEVPRKVVGETHRSLKQIEGTARSIGSSIWAKRPQVSVPTIASTQTESGGFVSVNSRGGFFQELGTVNHPPKPAMQPALDAHKDEWERRVKRVVKDS